MEFEEYFGMGIILFLVFMILMVFVTTLAPFLGGIHYELGRGEHNGYITATEKSGLFWQTGRAYLKTDTQSSQEDVYCVVDEEVYQDLSNAVVSKKHVVVSHLTWFMPAYWECGFEGAVIYAVKTAN